MPESGVGVSSGARPRSAWHSGERSTGQVVVVRSLTGFGEFAGLDTETGMMYEVDPGSPGASTELGGVFGHFDGSAAVFYRDRGDLMLRIGAVPIALGASGASVDWHRISSDTAYFRVLSHGVPSYEMRYRSDEADGDADLGRFVRDVLADPVRCARLFSR